MHPEQDRATTKEVVSDVLAALSLAMAALLLAILLLLGLAWLMPAKAHEHESKSGKQQYPWQCCHDQDCAPVTKVESVPTQKFVSAGLTPFIPIPLQLPSQTVLTTIHGTVHVPERFEQKSIFQSTDGQMHACIREGKLVCWFIPPGN